MRQTAKQIPAGGRHGGAADLYCTGADRTRWVWEGYPSRQDIYIINVSVSVCVSVFDKPWSDIVSTVSNSPQRHISSLISSANQQCRANIIVSVDFKLIDQ